MTLAAWQLDPPFKLDNGRLVLGFSGWMDGGDASSGTVEWLAQQLQADPVGTIDPTPFYILNMPGSMDVAALCRPHVEIVDGTISELEMPTPTLLVSRETNVALLVGREPNLNWPGFADSIFELASRTGVTEMCFVGSYAGVVPHSREPRLYGSTSHERAKPRLEAAGVRLASYEGPASFSTYLLNECRKRDSLMTTLVAEIPAYIEGTNPKCIETLVRNVAGLLELTVPLDELRTISSEWEERVSDAVDEKPDLAEHIEKLEEDYDSEIFDHQMGELKEWLEGRGIRVD